MLGPLQVLRRLPNPHRVVPLLVDVSVQERIQGMAPEEVERALTVVVQECAASYRESQHPLETYTAFEHVSELFDAHGDARPRALGVLHLVLAYLLITAFASRESIAVARAHSATAIEILAGRVTADVEADGDLLGHAMWYHAICEKMMGLAATAHDELVSALRDKQLASRLSPLGVAPLIRQLALIEQTA
jgi:hypothetical protein